MDDTQVRTVIDPAEIARGLREALATPATSSEPPPSVVESPAAAEPTTAEPPVDEQPNIEPLVAPLAPPDPQESSPGFVGRLVAEALPWAGSLCLNLVGLVTFALFAGTLLVEKPMNFDISFLAADPLDYRVEQIETLEIVAPTGEYSTGGGMTRLVGQLNSDLSQTLQFPGNQPIEESAVAVADMLVGPSGEISRLPSRATLDMPISVGVTYAPPTEKELNEAGSVEQAVDGVGSQVSQMLGEGNVLVVWLFDQSLSLVDDRQRVAARLETVYAQLEQEQQDIALQTGGKPPILTNAVVAFGSGMGEVVAPTGRPGRAVNAIREIPVDPTGVENVFSAVAGCAAKYGGSVKRQLLLVIWTDESGDDIYQLEPTINLCKQEKVRVICIGPTAVLGAEEGTHSWVHPQNGQLYYLPVKKGPDAPFPERIRWPYWWTTNLPAWHNDIGTRAQFEGWYGGYNLASMSSGFPPYALTRLTRETGGTMTIFDRALDSGPFRLSVMRSYAPDYRSAMEIRDELRYFPLRQAVLASVEVTRAYEGPPSPDTWIRYSSPAGMRRRLSNSAGEIEEAAEAIELALLPFGLDGLEDLYEREQSPRWRAWYDLTRGRLLAMSVRYAEYRGLVELLCRPGGIPDEANCLQIQPAPRLLLGGYTELRAREAERLLNRCVDENLDTPWAYLAQRELDHPLGVVHRAWYQEPPPPGPFVPGFPPSAPVVLPKL